MVEGLLKYHHIIPLILLFVYDTNRTTGVVTLTLTLWGLGTRSVGAVLPCMHRRWILRAHLNNLARTCGYTCVARLCDRRSVFFFFFLFSFPTSCCMFAFLVLLVPYACRRCSMYVSLTSTTTWLSTLWFVFVHVYCLRTWRYHGTYSQAREELIEPSLNPQCEKGHWWELLSSISSCGMSSSIVVAGRHNKSTTCVQIEG